MKKDIVDKKKLMLSIAVCVLLVAIVFSGAVAKKEGEEKEKYRDDDWDYWTNSPDMFSNNTGNVGIGTTTPNSKLEVAGIIHSTSGGFKFPDETVQTTAATSAPSNEPPEITMTVDGYVEYIPGKLPRYRYYINVDTLVTDPENNMFTVDFYYNYSDDIGYRFPDRHFVGHNGVYEKQIVYSSHVDTSKTFHILVEVDDGPNLVFGYADIFLEYVLDTDGDGLPDNEDNCPNIANPDQNDIDCDAYGDVCDCDNGNPDVNPGAEEVCDGIDNDCDGDVDEGCGCTCNDDCSAGEYCNKADGDCSGIGTCEDTPDTCPYVDDPVCGCDGETYLNSCYAAMAGVNVDYAGECIDFDGDGYTAADGDCDDTDPLVNPGADEVCDGLDNDCDGDVDEEVTCDDGNCCTTDLCMDGSCQHQEHPNGASCDDGDACTISDVCQNGECVGTSVTCDDSNPCTYDYCDPATGCYHPAKPNGTPCGTGYVCQDGNCQPV